MTPTLVATVGSGSANSYITAAEGDTYADERLQSSGWTGAATADKSRALIEATRRIDAEKFQGEKNADGQALKWPRIGATDDDGTEFATDAIPEIVQQATFELALHYLNEDGDSNDPLAPTGLEQFSEAKIGPLDVAVRAGFKAGELPETVQRLLRPVLETARSSGTLIRA